MSKGNVAEFEPDNWSGSAPYCAASCIKESVHCGGVQVDEYTEPACFCTLDWDTFDEDDDIYDCIVSDCYLDRRKRPEPKHFNSLCSEYSSTKAESTTRSTSQSVAAKDPPSMTEDAEPTGIPTLVSSGPEDPDTDVDGGISTSAIAAISICGPIAVLLVIAYIFRRRVRRWYLAATRKANGTETPSMAELDGGESFPDIRKTTKDDPYIPELTEQSRLPELDGTGGPGMSPPSGGGQHDGGPMPITPRDHAPRSSTGERPEAQSSDPPQTTQHETAGPGASTTKETVKDAAIPSATSPTVQDIPTPGGADEYARLRKLDGELEDKRRALAEIMQVQEQQTAIRERMRQLESQRDSQG